VRSDEPRIIVKNLFLTQIGGALRRSSRATSRAWATTALTWRCAVRGRFSQAVAGNKFAYVRAILQRLTCPGVQAGGNITVVSCRGDGKLARTDTMCVVNVRAHRLGNANIRWHVRIAVCFPITRVCWLCPVSTA
jgi:hypothetical protein